jgi:outer membrane protein assembly factor BamB
MQHNDIRTHIATRLLPSNTARPARAWYQQLTLFLLMGALGSACVVPADPEPTLEPDPLTGIEPAPAPAPVPMPAPAPAPAPGAKPDPAVLVIDRTAHDFGVFHVGAKSDEMVFTVRNGGPKPISGLALHWEQGIGFTVTATTCAGWLEPSAFCTIAVVFAPIHAGAVQTDLVVHASNLVARTTLAGTGAATLRIVNHVAGYQIEVLSDPAGISCGAICEATFTSHEIVLDKGLELAAWSGPCEPITESACLVRLEGDTTVELQFYEPGLLWSENIGYVRSLATDAENNVIAASNYDTKLVKYSPDGDLLWQVETPGDAYDIAVDAHGSIGLVAHEAAMLRKFDGAGNLQWTVETSSFESYARVAFDPSGNLHVAGTIFSWEDGTYSSRIHKYDPSGTLLWTREYASEWQPSITDMAVDQDGNTLVLIHEVVYNDDGGYRISNSLRKYDGDGSFLWMTALLDGASYLAIDTAGNIFLGSYMGVIEKRAPDGNHMWFASMTDLGFAESLAVTPAGDVIALGDRQFGDGASNREIWGIALDGTTGERRGRILIRSDIAEAWGSGIAVDRQGDVIIGGAFYSSGVQEEYWLRKYDGAVFD